MKSKVVFVEPMGAPSNIFAKFMSIPLLGPVYLATLAKKAGYDAWFGNDMDTKDIFKSTAQFSRKVKLEYVQYSALTPLPGTAVFEQFERENRLLHKNWNYYDGLHVVHSPKNMTALELQRGIVDCFRSFYSYSNAFREGTRTALRTVQSAGKYISDMKWHALYPTLIKVAGKHIVNEWTRLNQSYLNYLDEITHDCFQFPAPVDGK